MNTRYLIRLATGLLLWCVSGSNLLAQDLERFIVEPVDPNPAVSPHFDLVNTVQTVGGQIYVDVDRPEVNGNMVGAFLDPAEAQALRQQRPDLRIFPDSGLRPDAGGGPVPWSPDRIDQRVGTDQAYLPPMIEPCEDSRPFVYICDTGVFSKHDDFVSAGARLNLAGSYIPATLPRLIPAWEDPYDHGTAVAGCAVGELTGAGRCPANLVSAVCYPDPGALPAPSFASFAIDVIYWALNEHNLRSIDNDPFNDASVLVFASSTATGPSAILDLAVQRAYLGGMTVVVSAGNQNMDVTTTSPAGAVSVMHGDITLTVASSTVADARWANSNFGVNAELFAPGENVLTASSTGISTCLTRSGTSYSAGYVAGAAARILTKNPWAAPVDVAKVLTDQTDPIFAPSGPFGAGAGAVPKLLYVHQTDVPCIPMDCDEWLALFPANPSGPEEDPDCDRLVNIIEYFMALDPMSFVEKENRPRIVPAGGGGARYFFRKADYLCDTLEYFVEYSTDLMTWDVVPHDSIIPDASAPCLLTATWMVAPIPEGDGRVFARLRVNYPEGPKVGGGIGAP